jgi:hypothetical protein
LVESQSVLEDFDHRAKPIPVDMGARFTVNVNCSQTEEEKLMPIVDGETGEPIPDGENPYGARASKNGQ